jgi:MFS family permease
MSSTDAGLETGVGRHAISESQPFFRIFPLIMLPMFLAIADQTIVSAALPAIAGDLGDAEHISWIVVSYLVAATIAAPVYGRLGDVFGRRRMMLIALAVFTQGCVLCALSGNMVQLTLFRVIQGLGGGGLMTTSQALIGETIAPRERGRFQGYLASVAVTSNMIGPVIGGVLAGAYGWRMIFWANLPLVLVAAALAVRMPSRRADATTKFRFDGIGLLLFAVFVILTLTGLEQLPRLQLISPGLIAAGLVAWIAALALLVRYEARVKTPLIPVRLLGSPAIWRADALAACHGAALVSLITYLPVYLAVVRGTDASGTGLLLLPLTTALGIGSMTCGRIVSTTGRAALIPTLGLIVSTTSFVAVALSASVLGTTWFVLLLCLGTLFMGSVMAVVQITVQNEAGPGMLGAGAASVQFSRSIGAAIGTALVGIVLFGFLAATDPKAAALFIALVERGPQFALAGLDATARASLHDTIASAFRAAFLTIACFTGLGIVLAATNPVKRIS